MTPGQYATAWYEKLNNRVSIMPLARSFISPAHEKLLLKLGLDQMLILGIIGISTDF